MKNNSANPILSKEASTEYVYKIEQFEIQSLKSVSQRCVNKRFQKIRSHHYHIILVNKGSGEHLIDIDRNVLQANHIYCVHPYQIQNLKADPDLEGYMISFSADFLGVGSPGLNEDLFTGRFNILPNHSGIKINNELKSEILHIVLRMKKEANEHSYHQMDILRGYLKLFVTYIKQYSSSSSFVPERISGSELVDKFFNLLREHFISKKLVTEYASMLAVSPNYLNNVVKKISGFPASHHIKQQIHLEAKRQALFTNKSMKEIAFQLGFEEMSHFSKFFKNIEGNNFRHFRKFASKNLYL